ncbi:gfo/Idh/MocA family oxidoreductase [Candidatus Aerophobetes bacterium]|uniref:Gfo/Idh/MocA family oxidoreductase n=1 Tax=Aerophobetes bacterium TaxID=2030807 RepID=A0A662DJ81_UNCAE|nr:MAG: gfo/Idh/MocA family oxidoreductase [Candidatus Aerophobetes bacterium]
MEKVGFGVIGAGIWGAVHARVYAEDPRVRLVAICDIDRKKAKEVADKFGAESYYTDFQELVDNPDITAVSVATPDFAHFQPAMAAINKGKHLLIEKPIATRVEEAAKILEEAKKTKIKLMVDFHNRWNPCFLKIKSSIEKGEVGEVSLIYLRLSNPSVVPLSWFSWSGKSSVAWFLGSHTVDLARWLLKDEAKKVYCVSRSKLLRGKGVNTPDFFESIIEFEKGAVVVMENAWILPETEPNIVDFKCQVIGSKGSMCADLSHHRALEKYTEEKAEYPDLFALNEIYGKLTGFAFHSIEHFIDCVIEDKEPISTGKDGLEVTKIICAMEESILSGNPVRIR